jgi:hypothetical protein
VRAPSTANIHLSLGGVARRRRTVLRDRPRPFPCRTTCVAPRVSPHSAPVPSHLQEASFDLIHRRPTDRNVARDRHVATPGGQQDLGALQFAHRMFAPAPASTRVACAPPSSGPPGTVCHRWFPAFALQLWVPAEYSQMCQLNFPRCSEREHAASCRWLLADDGAFPCGGARPWSDLGRS